MKNISRRSFLKGVAATAALTAASSLMGTAALADDAADTLLGKETETYEAEIVVVGSGSSGICATVQAAELGKKTICLECNGYLGGNGNGTEGMFAVGSKMQKEQNKGADITFKQIVATEQEFFNYRVNALFWKDMVTNSAANLDWLIENGVIFSGVIDNYYGLGKFDAFHWFQDGKGSNFISPMAAKAEELGATFMTETRGRELILKDGKVAGILATKGDAVIRINCPVVILASGGYANNEEMMKERGYDLTYSINNGVPGHNGDGLKMAIQAGALDVSRQRGFLREPFSYGIDFFASMTQSIHRGGPVLWVNQDAQRYCNENCGAITPGNNSNAVHTQKTSYLIIDQGIIDTIVANGTDIQGQVDEAVAANPANNIYKADTIAELAEKIGLDAEALVATVDHYNEMCDNGDDEDFDKPADKMVALRNAPYYIFRQDLAFWTSVGGISTNRNMEAIDEFGVAIPGLYAVGTDGCELYRETYTMNVPASCNANNVNSGRTAAKNAAAYIG